MLCAMDDDMCKLSHLKIDYFINYSSSIKSELPRKKTSRSSVSRPISKKLDVDAFEEERINAAAAFLANIRSTEEEPINNLHFGPVTIEDEKEAIDMTPVGVIHKPRLDLLQSFNKKRNFTNHASKFCGCQLFTKGCLLSTAAEGIDEKVIPVILEIDMHRPVLNALATQ